MDNAQKHNICIDFVVLHSINKIEIVLTEVTHFSNIYYTIKFEEATLTHLQ
jgi:hypothetical protein